MKYTLDMQALASVSMFCKRSSCHQLVSQLSCFYPYCSISYFGLITGSDVDKMTNIVTGGILTFVYYIDHLSCPSLLVFSFVCLFIIITFICLAKCTEDEDDYMSCLSYVKHGASLSGSCF